MAKEAAESNWYLEKITEFEQDEKVCFPLKFGENQVGRSREADISLVSSFISRKHCMINVAENGIHITLTDFKSSNGTHVNMGHFIGTTATLQENFKIGIGCTIEMVSNPECIVFLLKRKRLSFEIIDLDSDSDVEIKDVIIKSENHCNYGDSSGADDLFNLLNEGNDNEPIVLDSDVDEEEEEKMQNWMLKLSQNMDSVRIKSQCFHVKEEPLELYDVEKPLMNFDLDLDIDDDGSNQSILIEESLTKKYEQVLKPCRVVLRKLEETNNQESSKTHEPVVFKESTISASEAEKPPEIVKQLPKKEESRQKSAEPHHTVEKLRIIKRKKIRAEIDSEDEDSWQIKKKPRHKGLPDSEDEATTSVKSTDSDNRRKSVSRKAKAAAAKNVNSRKTIEQPVKTKAAPAKIASKRKSIGAPNNVNSRNSIGQPVKIKATPAKTDSRRTSIGAPVVSEAKPTNVDGRKIIEQPVEIQATPAKIASRRKTIGSPVVSETTPAKNVESLSSMGQPVKIIATPAKIENRRKTIGAPVVIEAPFMPSGKGKLRGFSSITTDKFNVSHEMERKRAKLRLYEKLDNLHKRKDTSVAKLDKDELMATRKARLKEVENAKSLKKTENNNISCTSKVLTKPKVKITDNNRGTFLVEMTNNEPARRMSRCASLGPASVKVQNFVNEPIAGPSPKLVGQQNKIKEPRAQNDKSHDAVTVSILRPKHACKTKKRVRFIDQPTVTYYEQEYDNPKSRLLKPQAFLVVEKQRLLDDAKMLKEKVSRHAIGCQTEDVITDILSWKGIWLWRPPSDISRAIAKRNAPCPMLQVFDKFETYKNVIVPIMQMELFEEVCRCSRKRLGGWIVRSIVRGAQRGNNKRNVFSCELLNRKLRSEEEDLIRPGRLLIINQDDEHWFGYVTNMETKTNRDVRSYVVTFETQQTFVTDLTCVGRTLQLKSLMSLNIELAIYRAVFFAEITKFSEIIINPLKNMPKLPENKNTKKNCPDNSPLNTEQNNALEQSLNFCGATTEDINLLLIEGPPGTGKSHVVVEIVNQLLKQNEAIKILICSASNAAIDTITERLVSIRNKCKAKNLPMMKLVRYGCYDKMSPTAKTYSLQQLSEQNMKRSEIAEASSSRSSIDNAIEQEKKMIEEQIQQFNVNGSENTIDMDKLRDLQNRWTKLDQALQNTHSVEQTRKKLYATELILIGKAQVVCTTLSSCVQLKRLSKSFDVCIVDEATQCTEPQTLVPLEFKIKGLMLIGDVQQLPAVILSKDAKELGLGVSLFSRIQNCFVGPNQCPVVSLTRQYRMHPEICSFPNQYFYKNRLVTDEKCSKRSFSLKPYIVISTNCFQNITDNNSTYNKDESTLISKLVAEICNLVNINKHSVGIITPYQQQREQLVASLAEMHITKVDVRTIDSFQGCEKNVIIFSTTRTSSIGFMDNPQRLNVALTRAKDCLIICGNFISVKSVPVWEQLLVDAKKRNVFYEYDASQPIETLAEYIKKV